MTIRRPCAQPGCPNLVRKGYCEEHATKARKRYDEGRGSARDRGYTTRWDEASKAYRRKHPLCVRCLNEGRTTPTELVDHITPADERPDLFWDESNWQSLCRPHHAEKTAEDEARRSVA